METDRYQSIILPTAWDEEKDFAYFEERWEPTPSYTKALWRMLRFHCGRFQRALDTGLIYFGHRDSGLVHVEPRCLTPAEKIEALLEVARTSDHVAAYRTRLLEDLQACEHTERERVRVLRDYRLARHGAPMYPVIELIDYLGGSAVYLEETLQCETRDFRAVTQEYYAGWQDWA